jgi:hypothetical protein
MVEAVNHPLTHLHILYAMDGSWLRKIYVQEGGGRCWQKVSNDDHRKVNKVGKGDGNGNDSNGISLGDGTEQNNNTIQFC